MPDPIQAIRFDEAREPSLLERVLTSSRFDRTAALALFGTVIAISLALFHLFVAGFGVPESKSFRSAHLAGMLVLAFLINPLGRKGFDAPVWVPGDPGNFRRSVLFAVDMVLIAVTIGIELYTLYDVEALVAREGAPTEVRRFLNPYDRDTFKQVTTQPALEMLRRRLLALDD